MNGTARRTLENAMEACVGCGLCTGVQEESGELPLEFGQIAERMLEVVGAAASEGRALKPLDLPDDVYEFSRSCMLCERCTVECPEGIRAAEVVSASRSVIAEAMPRMVKEYRRYRCDMADSMFNRMRAVQGVEYDEYLPRGLDVARAGDDCGERTLYFPGCTLANNFPQLNRVVEATLLRDGLANCTTSFCCGRPLVLIGIQDEYENYTSSLCGRLVQCGVTRLITACPNCYYEFRKVLAREGLADSIELKFLTEVLAEAGYRFVPDDAHPYRKVGFHDSCPDRHDGVIARSMRTLFENVEIAEVEHGRSNSVCCGAGGFAAVFSPVVPQHSYAMGVGEFRESGAECMVVACANCASTYKSPGDVNCKHYLELVLGTDMDMGAYTRAMEQLWDPQSEIYIESYADDTPFFETSAGAADAVDINVPDACTPDAGALE